VIVAMDGEDKIREVNAADACAIAAIYNWSIDNTTVTFEVAAVSVATIKPRIAPAGGSDPWLVLERAGQILGYAYAMPWKARAAYGRTKETSVYVHHSHGGRGIGRALMIVLVEKIRCKPIHVLIAGITLPNPASIALHERLGFVPIGEFAQVGFKFDRYIDVGYWQLLMENT
jgi:L-amino acid N-acyltransferase YncA